MVKLQSLKVRKYRSVARNTSLEFGPSINVILGPNGAGKTALLELIARILGPNSPELCKEEFDLTVSLECRDGRCEIDLENIERSVETSALEATGQQKLAAFDLQIEVRLYPHTAKEPIVLQTLDGKDERPAGVVGIPKLAVGRVPIGVLIAMASVNVGDGEAAKTVMRFGTDLLFPDLWRIDEGTGYFEEVLLRQVLEVEGEPYLPAAVLWSDSVGTAMVPSGATSSIEFELAQSATLRRALDLLSFKTGVVRFDRISSPRQESQLATYGNASLQFRRRDDTFVHHEHLSFGQRRLLSFFWGLARDQRVVIADELANGLHYSWIRDCLDAIGARQAFLSSQNPLLLNALEFESPEDVKRTFVICRPAFIDGKEYMSWRHPTDDEAREFWDAYEVGIQYVGEILESQGLW